MHAAVWHDGCMLLCGTRIAGGKKYITMRRRYVKVFIFELKSNVGGGEVDAAQGYAVQVPLP